MTTIQSILAETPNATDAEILAAIEASRDWRRVPVAEVTLWLLENGLLGVLQYIRDTTTDAATRVGLSEFLAGLTLYQSIDATDTTIRTKAQMLTGALAQASVISGEQLASFTSLMKEPNTIGQTQIDQYRREIEIQSDIDAAAQATDVQQQFIASARNWIASGGTKPTR